MLGPTQQAGSKRQPATHPSPPTPQWDRSTPRTADVEETDASESRHQSSSPQPLPLGCNPFIPQPLSPLGWHVSHLKVYTPNPTPTAVSIPELVFLTPPPPRWGVGAGRLDPWWGATGCLWKRLDLQSWHPACLEEHQDKQGALAGGAQWIERRPADQTVAGSFPVRAQAWDCGQVPSWGRVRGNQSTFLSHKRWFSPSLSLPPL